MPTETISTTFFATQKFPCSVAGSAPSFPGSYFGKTRATSRFLCSTFAVPSASTFLYSTGLSASPSVKVLADKLLDDFLFSSAWRFSCCSAALLRSLPSLPFSCSFIYGSTTHLFSLLIYALALSLLLLLRNRLSSANLHTMATGTYHNE